MLGLELGLGLGLGLRLGLGLGLGSGLGLGPIKAPQPRSTHTCLWEATPAGCSSHHTPDRIAAHACTHTQAPELFAFPPVISAAADVYAFAVLAWVVCTREQPYQGLQSPETVMKEMLMQATPPPSLEFYQPCLPLHLSLVARSSALTLTLPLPLSPPPATIPTPKPSP